LKHSNDGTNKGNSKTTSDSGAGGDGFEDEFHFKNYIKLYGDFI